MKLSDYESRAKDEGDRQLSNQLLVEITTLINAHMDKFIKGVDPDTVDVSGDVFTIIQKSIYSKLQHLCFCPENFSFKTIDISQAASSYLGMALKFCDQFQQFSFHNMNFASDSYDSLFFELSCRPVTILLSFDSCVFDPKSIHSVLSALSSSVMDIKSVCFKNMKISPWLDMLESYKPPMCNEFIEDKNVSTLLRDFITSGIIVLQDCDLSADDINQDVRTVIMNCK